MYKISFYVPEAALEHVKQAMFDAGAGRIGNYDSCAWQTLGEGQFRPLQGSNPALGEVGSVENLLEFKVEMVCADDKLKAAIGALCAAHPYEEPAYQYWKVNQAMPNN
ncbi:MAG: NGG1p interacting factor NIF3 [Gammaproteobacteria bacterium]|nr:NGG1p interacting factor NIF3 [Gammaproteobacteria bacterium]NND38014.1 NGG1p interacting factor NIF3 [Pseudomonadales bacterium]NNL11649.1 NGG1p interacting factor NIF3 [Pseudomonadales bacterium]NNM12282.1 NGG1p interacting factor NIF3 [Pseudomonadales bacterium]